MLTPDTTIQKDGTDYDAGIAYRPDPAHRLVDEIESAIAERVSTGADVGASSPPSSAITALPVIGPPRLPGHMPVPHLGDKIIVNGKERVATISDVRLAKRFNELLDVDADPEYPWLKIPEESPQAYEMFSVYRDLGPTRSVPKAVAKMGRKNAAIRKCKDLSMKFQWRQRCKAYDNFIDREKVNDALAAKLEMNTRQARLGKLMTEAAEVAVPTLDPAKMDAYAVSTLALAGTKIERLARGETTENQGTKFEIIWNGEQPEWAKGQNEG